MKRLVLHIGLEKTGSTSFQAFCAENRDRIGALYPSNPACFSGINHAPLVASYFTASEASALLIAGRRTDRREAVAAFSEEVEQACRPRERGNPGQGDVGWHLGRRLRGDDEPPRILISAEHFSSRFDPARITLLAEDLRAFETSIAVVVRHPLGRAASAYATTVASGRSLTLDAFVDELCQSGDRYLRSRPVLMDWADVFGRERMDVFAYREGQDIVHALSAHLLPQQMAGPLTYLRNASPSAAATERRRRANEGGVLRKLLSRAHIGRYGPDLTPEQSAKIMAHVADDLDWLRQTYGVDLSF